MRDFFQIAGCLAFLALLVWACLPHGSGRYTIVTPNGKYSEYYNTDAYRRHGECVSFVCAGDSMTVCGTYRIK